MLMSFCINNLDSIKWYLIKFLTFCNMAFGKTTEVRIKNPILEDQYFRANVLRQERSCKIWEIKWNCLLEEYKKLHEKLSNISKDSVLLTELLKDTREKDRRCIRPIPITTNHQYGWIPNKPDFKLEKYGPDYDRGAPLPEMYHIFKG